MREYRRIKEQAVSFTYLTDQPLCGLLAQIAQAVGQALRNALNQ